MIILAIVSQSHDRDAIMCKVTGDQLISGTIKLLKDSHGTELTAAEIICPLATTHLVTSYGQVALNSLYLVKHDHANRNQDPVVCVRPLFGPFNDTLSLIQFLAFYKSQGINNFIFFNLAIEANVRKLLNNVVSVHIQVFDWDLTNETLDHIASHGQINAIKFCLDLFPNQPVIHVDIDEFLTTGDCSVTIRQFIADYMTTNPDKVALIIKNVLFCDQFNSNQIDSDQFEVLRNFNRQKHFWHWNKKSKVIYLTPKMITDPGIHYVWGLDRNLIKNFYNYVQELDGISMRLHHYRDCCVKDTSQVLISYDVFGRELDLIRFHPLEDAIVRDDTLQCWAKEMRHFVNENVRIS